MEKHCSQCGELKSVKHFSEGLHGGSRSACKPCLSARSRAWRLVNREAVLAGKRAYRLANPEKIRARAKLYRESNPEICAAASSRYRSRNAEKIRAQKAIYHEIRSGSLVPPTTCSECGAEAGRIEGHHDDYSRVLEVRWLCHGCHVSFHQGE